MSAIGNEMRSTKECDLWTLFITVLVKKAANDEVLKHKGIIFLQVDL